MSPIYIIIRYKNFLINIDFYYVFCIFALYSIMKKNVLVIIENEP